MVLAGFKNNRGIALLITLTVVTILAVVTMELNRKARFSAVAAALNRDRLTLFHMASAGIHAGMGMLIKDKNDSEIDFLQEGWADPEKLSRLLQETPFERGQVDLKITDELGKIQVNALVEFPEGKNVNIRQEQLWLRFIEQFNVSDSDTEDIQPSAIVNSIKDWLDSGDDDAITGLQGAESDYYEGLQPPYPSKNGPLHHLGELTLIKGITPTLFYGLEQVAGISSHLTIYGLSDLGGNKSTYPGKININTAGVPVLTALFPPGSEDLAQFFVEYRQETQNINDLHDISNPQWYKQVPGLGHIDISSDLIRTSSDIFSLKATASLNTMKMTLEAVIMREKDAKTGQWRCKILNLRQN